jgi:hypothetical protein
MMVQANGIGIMGKDIDGRRCEEEEIFRFYLRRWEREIVEFKGNLQPRALPSVLPTVPTYKVKEKKFFRKDEVFLKNSITGKGMGWIGNQTLPGGEANRF